MLWHVSAVVASMTVNRDQRWPSLDVLGDTTTMDWDSLKGHQSLSNLSIRSWINIASLGITKELVQCIVASLSIIIGSMLSKVSPMADRVIDWSVGWLLLRSIVSIVSIVVGASIVGSRAWVDLSVVVVITSTVSCKILQVSNYYFLSDVGMLGNNRRCCFTYLFHLVCTQSSDHLHVAPGIGGGQSRLRVSLKWLAFFTKLYSVMVTYLYMLLQVLRTLEGLSTEFTFVRLQWNVYSNVGSDMIALDGGGSAGIPPTGEIQVVCTLPSDMLLADVILQGQLVMGQ